MKKVTGAKTKSRNAQNKTEKVSSLQDEEEGEVEEETDLMMYPKKPNAQPEDPLEKADLSLIDFLCSNIENADVKQYAILCGYFKKIMVQIIAMKKDLLFEYVIYKREGKLFKLLTKHLNDYSISVVLVEMLTVSNVYSKQATNQSHFREEDEEEPEIEEPDTRTQR